MQFHVSCWQLLSIPYYHSPVCGGVLIMLQSCSALEPFCDLHTDLSCSATWGANGKTIFCRPFTHTLKDSVISFPVSPEHPPPVHSFWQP